MYKLNEKRYLEIRDLLDQHDLRQLEHAKQVNSTCKRSGISVNELHDYLDDMNHSVEITEKKVQSIMGEVGNDYLCPECGKWTNILPVNDTKATQVGDNWRSVTYCMDIMGCGWEEYSEERFKAVLSNKMKRLKNRAIENGVNMTVDGPVILTYEYDRKMHNKK